MTRGTRIARRLAAVGAVLVLGVAGWRIARLARLESPENDALLPLRVDAALGADGARSPTEAWPIVRADGAPDGSIALVVFDVAADGKNQKLELDLRLGVGAQHVPARVTWYGDDAISIFGPYEDGRAIAGSVTVDADRLPGADDARVVDYELTAQRDDVPVDLRGKVRVPSVPKSASTR